jgi:hypothetical protein
MVPAATTILNSTSKMVGTTLIFASLGVVAYAQTQPAVPEVDAGSASSALALLFGGMMLLRSRFRAK